MNNNNTINSTLRFVVLLILQVLVLNHFNLFGSINPMVYIVWVVLFPIQKNESIVLILSFLLGLGVDFFSDSGGINAAATLFIAYIRVPILNMVLGKSDFDYVLFNLRSIPLIKAITYISLITFIHHFIIYSLELLRFGLILDVFLRTLFNTIFTSIICILTIYLIKPNKR